MPAAERILVSCEHGGHRVPRAYAQLFADSDAVLAGHRGWDPGALALARCLARKLRAPLHATTVNRLLVDPNRSRHHRRLFSEFTSSLDRAEREAILERYYLPHRRGIERRISAWVRGGARVLHLAIHSFDPRLDPERERCDLGLLYDPRRRSERELCSRWQAGLRDECGLRVRRNYPYRGNADGLTKHLRGRFSAASYLGIEVEGSQARLADAATLRLLGQALAETVPARRAGRP